MIFLVYDLDGTLVISSKQITYDMISMLETLKNRGYKNIIVSGGTYQKIKWQLQDRYDLFDMIFAECGAVLYQNDKLIYQKQVTDLIDKTVLNNIKIRFIEMCNEIEFEYVGERFDMRNGLIYLTPVGMEADDKLRAKFIMYENNNKFRETLIHELKILDTHDQLEMVKGGKTGISIYPKGIDKTQILEYIPDVTIYFFGDNCREGGNDKCLYEHERCIGYEVRNYYHTLNLLNQFIN